MKIGFIASPYMAGNWDVIEQNIIEAEEVAIELANRGVFFFCPHNNTRHFQIKVKAPDSFYRTLSLRMLKTCDFLVTTPRWVESKGAREAVRICRDSHKVIFYLQSLDDVKTYNAIEQYAKGRAQ